MVQPRMTSSEAARAWGVSERRVNELCRTNRIDGAQKRGGRWVIPADAQKPADARRSPQVTQDSHDIPLAFRHKAQSPGTSGNLLPLPVGVSDFRRLVSTYYYVDKTLLIRDIIDAQDYVTLFTRPRRFGKTLNMDMLRVFFEKTDEDTARYFRGSLLWRCGEKYQAYQGRYPTIFLTLKDVKASTYQDALALLRALIQREFLRHAELGESSRLGADERSLYLSYCNGTASDVELSQALLNLSLFLAKHHQESVVIIIDEYDTPIEQGYAHGYYDDITNFIRVFFSGAFKDNPSLKFGFMTGILRVAKEGIFSGLNNIQVYSVLDGPYATYFGFTPDEVRAMATYYDVPGSYDELCSWYDGYRFGNADIFNPWSVISYFRNNGKAQPYWVSTANNEILGQIVRHAGTSVIEQLHALVSGKSVAATVNMNVVYPRLDADASTIFSFLLMAGYLKVVGSLGNAPGTPYRLSIPNREVRQAFVDEVLAELSQAEVPAPVTDMQSALVLGDASALQAGLRQFLLSSASYYDTANESFYHGLMLGLCALLSSEYRIRSNREAGEGRFDICLEPRRSDLPGIILELKAVRTADDGSLDDLARRALDQVRDRRYAVELRNAGVGSLFAYGVAFSGKSIAVAMERW